jgi:hypothetical protein
VVAREHAEEVIAAFCAAETAGDRDAWLALFAPDADGRLRSVRAFVDMGATRPDPE